MNYCSRILCLLNLVLISHLAAGDASAKGIKLSLNKLVVNAEYIEASNKQNPFFLILHGTLAWHGMELPKTIQELLADESYGSLAFTLSLGENDRSGFFDCSHPINSGHHDAQPEITLWIKQLKKMGYQNIYLIGHSRGGAQMATYGLENNTEVNGMFLIAPLVWNKHQVHKSYKVISNIDLKQQLDKIKSGTSKTLKKQDLLHCKQTTVSTDAFLSYYDELPEKNTPTLLRSILIPTKIYLGDSDPLTKSFLEQKFLFSNNKLVSSLLIEDADHYFRDFAAEEIVTDIIASFSIENL